MTVLDDEDYKDVLCEAFEQDRPPELKKAIRKRLEKTGKRLMKGLGEGVPEECDTEGCPEPSPSREISRSAGKVNFSQS